MNPVEYGSRLLAASRRGQRLDQPERADHKGDRGLAETVVQAIALQPAVPRQVPINCIDRAAETGISWGKKAQADHLQQGSVQVFAAIVAHETLLGRVPGLRGDFGMDPVGGRVELRGERRLV